MPTVELTYDIEIDAPAEKVWDTTLGAETYPQWVKAFAEGATLVGEWVEGQTIDFIDPPQGGTRALLRTLDRPRTVDCEHVAMLGPDGSADTESEPAKAWVGTTETYHFTEHDGSTTMRVVMVCDEQFAPMFDGAWPEALRLLKGLCEG